MNAYRYYNEKLVGTLIDPTEERVLHWVKQFPLSEVRWRGGIYTVNSWRRDEPPWEGPTWWSDPSSFVVREYMNGEYPDYYVVFGKLTHKLDMFCREFWMWEPKLDRAFRILYLED